MSSFSGAFLLLHLPAEKGCSPHGGCKRAPLFLQADPAWFSSLWHKRSGMHFSSPVTLSHWQGRLETALGFKDYVARPGVRCDSSRSGWKTGRASAGTQPRGGKRSIRCGIPSRMLGVPGAVPEARCLSAAGLQSHCPHPGGGMGSSFSKGLTPPAVPRVPGRRGVLSSCPTQQVYCPALPPCLLSSPEHLSSACCSQARLPLGGYDPFRRSGSLWEVRLPSKSQQQLCKHNLSRAELAAPPCGCPVPCTRSLLPAVLCVLLATLTG